VEFAAAIRKPRPKRKKKSVPCDGEKRTTERQYGGLRILANGKDSYIYRTSKKPSRPKRKPTRKAEALV
jgi:hypothetical protein